MASSLANAATATGLSVSWVIRSWEYVSNNPENIWSLATVARPLSDRGKLGSEKTDDLPSLLHVSYGFPVGM
jgi:hypothetical protein